MAGLSAPGTRSLQHLPCVPVELLANLLHRTGLAASVEFHRAADDATGIADEVGNAQDAPLVEPRLGIGRRRYVRPLQDQLGIDLLDVVRMDAVGSRRRDEDVAGHGEEIRVRNLLTPFVPRDASRLVLGRGESGDVDPTGVVHRSLRVTHGDERHALLRQGARRRSTDTAEPLDGHRGSGQLHIAELHGDLGADRQAEAGRADLVQRNPAHYARQAGASSYLVSNPCHARLVRAHIGSGDVLRKIANGLREGAYEPLLIHLLGLGDDSGFPPTVRQTGTRILEGHGTREPEDLFRRHVGRHAYAAQGRTAGDVVDDDDASQPDRGLVDMDDFVRTKLVAEVLVIEGG